MSVYPPLCLISRLLHTHFGVEGRQQWENEEEGGRLASGGLGGDPIGWAWEMGHVRGKGIVWVGVGDTIKRQPRITYG
jgi:hypothetical protein